MTKMKHVLNIPEFRHFAFPLTNMCNLSCDCCSVHADLPIDKDSIYPERRKLYRMSPSDVQTFVEKLGDLGKSDYHRLTGGEPTLFIDDCVEIIEYLHSEGRRICLATNGLNLCKIPPHVLKWIDWVELDHHNTNEDTIKECKVYLKQHYPKQNRLRIIKYGTHFDLHYARFHYKNQHYCGHVMRVVKYRDGVIYPCGHFECLTTFRHDTDIQDLLIKHGWTIDNPDIPFMLEHWRETLPLDIFKYCMSCWRPKWKLRKLPRMK